MIAFNTQKAQSEEIEAIRKAGKAVRRAIVYGTIVCCLVEVLFVVVYLWSIGK